MSTSKGKLYDSLDELKAATAAIAAEGWRKAARRDMTPEDRANFANRNESVDEQLAATIAEKLSDALTMAANFDRAHRRPEVSSGPMGRGLLLFIQRFLPFLIEAERFTGDGLLAAVAGGGVHGDDDQAQRDRPVDVNLAMLKRMRDRPSVVAALPHLEEGWTVSMNNRVFGLLGEESERGYWRMFGLTESPSDKTMAYAAILLGQFPTNIPLPARVSDVIDRAEGAIRAARAHQKRP